MTQVEQMIAGLFFFLCALLFKPQMHELFSNILFCQDLIIYQTPWAALPLSLRAWRFAFIYTEKH
jgi:hypothetical protein